MPDRPTSRPGQPTSRRFDVPALHLSLAAHRPDRALLISDASGRFQLYAWDTSKRTPRRLTDHPQGITFAGLSPDGATIYYHPTDDDGIGPLLRLPFDAAPDSPGVPVLPDLPPLALGSLSLSLDGRWLGIAAHDGVAFSLRLADLARGTQRTLYRTNQPAYGPLLSYDGRYAVVAAMDRAPADGSFAALAFDLAQASQSADVRVLGEPEGSVQPLAFSPKPGDDRVLCATDAAGPLRPLIWHVASGDREDFPLLDIDGDLRPLGWSPAGDKLLLQRLYQAQYRLYVYDLRRSTLVALPDLPGTLESAAFLPGNGARIVLTDQTPESPPRIRLIDARSGAPERTLLDAADLLAHDLPPGRPWRSITLRSTGGAAVQAWLCLPDGDGPFPAMIHAHGGPTDVQTAHYDPAALAWADAGFAWLSVNYRGSISFGQDHETAVRGMLGLRESDDLAAAAEWLVAEGIALPAALFVTGASYGGYLALQALGRRPDLWAGGIAEAAIADWAATYADASPDLRAYQEALFGGPPDAMPAIIRSSSPISTAGQVAAPLYLLQARQDPRVPARQMQGYLDALAHHGADVTITWTAAPPMRQERAALFQDMLAWALRQLHS